MVVSEYLCSCRVKEILGKQLPVRSSVSQKPQSPLCQVKSSEQVYSFTSLDPKWVEFAQFSRCPQNIFCCCSGVKYEVSFFLGVNLFCNAAFLTPKLEKHFFSCLNSKFFKYFWSFFLLSNLIINHYKKNPRNSLHSRVLKTLPQSVGEWTQWRPELCHRVTHSLQSILNRVLSWCQKYTVLLMHPSQPDHPLDSAHGVLWLLCTALPNF